MLPVRVLAVGNINVRDRVWLSIGEDKRSRHPKNRTQAPVRPLRVHGLICTGGSASAEAFEMLRALGSCTITPTPARGQSDAFQTESQVTSSRSRSRRGRGSPGGLPSLRLDAETAAPGLRTETERVGGGADTRNGLPFCNYTVQLQEAVRVLVCVLLCTELKRLCVAVADCGWRPPLTPWYLLCLLLDIASMCCVLWAATHHSASERTVVCDFFINTDTFK